MSESPIDLVPLRRTLESWIEGRSLSESDAADVLRALTDTQLPAALAGGLLAALQTKGVSAAELRGFATAMRALARRPQIPPTLHSSAIDIVGTGGDASGSVNLSTGTALLVAACGVPVIKHGNRSVSSRSGSADVLEQLGLTLPLDETRAGERLTSTGFTFLFAPHYHPAMKAIAPVRQALGIRTIFNVLGPLTNPATPPFALIGAYREELAELMAETLAGMSGLRRTFVVHGAAGWDEPTPIGPFTLFDIENGCVRRSVRTPEDYGLPRCTPQALAGGDAIHNAAELAAALRPERAARESINASDTSSQTSNRVAHRHALLLGAALALECAGVATDAADGIAKAQATIESGAAARLVESLRT